MASGPVLMEGGAIFLAPAALGGLRLAGSRSLVEEAILDRLPYPFLDQSLCRVRYASAVGAELGQLVQILPGCQGKCYRSAVGVGHPLSYHGSS